MLPRPKNGESEADYVARALLVDSVIKEFPKQEQRAAACHAHFTNANSPLANVFVWNADDKGKILGIRHLMSKLVEEKTLDGNACLVLPTILIVEGVHNQLYYPAEELAKFPASWDGKPVVVNHPELEGKPVQAGKKEIIEKQTVGVVLNTRWDEESKKLKAEVWINIEKCKKLCEKIITMLEDNQNLEVSTGLFAEGDGVVGKWGEEDFLATLVNYRPDHLALLPDNVGACSWEDGGGGPRTNEDKTITSRVRETIANMAKTFSKWVGNEISHSDIWEKISTAIKEKEGGVGTGNNIFVWVRDVFDKYFIYELEKDGTASLFKRSYLVTTDDEVELIDDAIEVEQESKYVPVNNKSKITGGKQMDRTEKIEALVSNKKLEWTAEDTELLTNMTEEQFARVEKGAEAQLSVLATAEATANAEAEEKVRKDKEDADKLKENEDKDKVETKKTIEEVVNSVIDPEMKKTLSRAIARDKAIKEGMVVELQANKACKYTKEQLENKDIEELEALLALSGSAKNTQDFSVRTPAKVIDNEEAIPAMPKVFANKDKK